MIQYDTICYDTISYDTINFIVPLGTFLLGGLSVADRHNLHVRKQFYFVLHIQQTLRNISIHL